MQSPGEDSAYERVGDARRKFWIKPVKETDLGVAQAFLTPKRDEKIYICPEHPKWDQNPKFTPLSETATASIPTHMRSPPPLPGCRGAKWSEALNAKKKSKTDINLYDIEIVQVDRERKRFKIHFVRLGLEINSTSGVISVPAVDSFRLSAWRKVLSLAKNHWRTCKEVYFSWAFIPSC